MKYPKTFHLPWSLGVTDDDKIISNLDRFVGRRVIVSKKMDGENTTLRKDTIHARSLDGRGGVDRDWVKGFWSGFCYQIPDNWRICGENLWAKHTIYYTDLPSYFLGFSVWDENNICLDWDMTLMVFDSFGITPVPVLYDGMFDEKQIKGIEKTLDLQKDEGYVVRIAESFHYDDFDKCVAKFVREGHVQTDKHWRTRGIFVPNQLST